MSIDRQSQRRRIMGTTGAGAADPDRISGLHDHLLHEILARLPSTAEAARTSVLSRRWRRIWAHTPVICLRYGFDPETGANQRESAARGPGRVDAALAAHAAGGTGTGTSTSTTVSLSRLEIDLPSDDTAPHLRMDRVAAWLRVAARRLAGELRIRLPFRRRIGTNNGGDGEALLLLLLLPPCERATSVSLYLNGRPLRFALSSGGVFRALATLTIQLARLHGGDLETAVSSARCPCLKKLVLEWIELWYDDGGGDGARDLAIRSDSLEWLEISDAGVDEGLGGRLSVHAPNLQTFGPSVACDLCVVAPNRLSEVRWRGGWDYDSGRHHLASAGHQLRRLEVQNDPAGLALMRQFNTVHELDLTIRLTQGVEEYERFLKYTDTLARCKVLVVRFDEIEHGFQPAMLHLLRKCAGIQRLVLHLRYGLDGYSYPCKQSSGCLCSRLENCKTHNVVLDSLEEVVITKHGGVDQKVEVVKLLCRCSTRFQKKVAITVLESGGTDILRNKILSISYPPKNDRTEIIVRQST